MNIVTCPDLGSNQHTPDAMESTSPRIVGSRRVELPFDIYTYIIDLVAKTYYPLHMEDIKAMSLVRRALVAPCQKFLFRSVTYSVKVARKLLQIHDASPHLVDYVRQLDLKFSADHRSDIDRPSEVTVEFFNKFRNLSRLDFAFNSRNMVALTATYDWKKINPSVATALLALLRRQTRLETLSISGIKGFPLQGILSLEKHKHLKTFAISCVTLDFTDVAQTADLETSNTVATGPGHLERFGFGADIHEALLVLTGSPDSPAKNHAILDFSSIEVLSVDWKDANDLAWTKLIMQSSPYLLGLHLELTHGSKMSFDGLAAAILAGPSQTINHITLRRNHNEPDERNDDPLYGVNRELQRLSGKVNALKSVDIYISIYCAEADTAVGEICTTIGQQCTALDMTVATENAFPALRSLEIQIVVMVPDNLEFPDSILKSIEKSFNHAAVRVQNACFKKLEALSSLELFQFELQMDWIDQWE